MRSRKRRVAKLGLALVAAVLALTAITAMAAAEPADTAAPTPPPPSSESSEPPTESSAPPASESTAPPPSNEPPEPAAIEDIGVTAEFGKPLYATGETIDMTLTITNTSTEGKRLDVFFPSYGTVDGIHVSGTGDFGRDVVIAAGESVSGELTGVMLNPNVDTAKLYVTLSGDFTERHEFSVSVTRRVATASGIVYHDKNGDGNLDSGEGLGGAAVTFTNRRDVFVSLYTTTNADGTFSIEVTPGDYYVDVNKAGVLRVNAEVTVPESGVDGLLYRTRQELSQLAVDLEFGGDTYTPTEMPTVRVTLTNNSDLPLTGIVARCNSTEGGPGLTGATAGWGALAGDGLAIAPHTTTVLKVSEPMPAAAHDYGYVQVDCEFAYKDMWSSGSPRDTDRATVPGQFAEVTGQIRTYPEDVDLSGFRVVVTAAGGQCPIIAEAVTGKDGRFSLGKLPAGRYHYYVVPPPPGWWFKFNNHGETDVVANRPNEWSFLTAPNGDNGSIVQPPNCPGNPGGPGTPGTNPPAPQGSAGTGLAYTGASMLVPGIAGLLALLAGTGAVLVTRRRRTEGE
jgi:hypothetical protein